MKQLIHIVRSNYGENNFRGLCGYGIVVNLNQGPKFANGNPVTKQHYFMNRINYGDDDSIMYITLDMGSDLSHFTLSFMRKKLDK